METNYTNTQQDPVIVDAGFLFFFHVYSVPKKKQVHQILYSK